MKPKKQPAETPDADNIIYEARKTRKLREQGFREQALKLFPHVCGRCGREFSGKKLRELTVHHRNHNHNDNPPNGSNWELLCLYCHDNEHQKRILEGTLPPADVDRELVTYRPFADLKKKLSNK